MQTHPTGEMRSYALHLEPNSRASQEQGLVAGAGAAPCADGLDAKGNDAMEAGSGGGAELEGPVFRIEALAD